MTSILKDMYATQDEIKDDEFADQYHPHQILAGRIDGRLHDFYMASAMKNEEIDWSTLSITTRYDALVGGLLLSCRVNTT